MKLQQSVNRASKIIGKPLPSAEFPHTHWTIKQAKKIISNTSHPAHHLFQLLPSGRHYRLSTKTKCFKIFPMDIRSLNSSL